jgi:transposase
MKVEILGGIKRRRRWHWEEKARLVEETLAPGATVAEVGRRHGVAPSLLFYWRRQARDGLLEHRMSAPVLVPVEVADTAPTVAITTDSPAQRRGLIDRAWWRPVHPG